jgi:hypothetical protein
MYTVPTVPNHKKEFSYFFYFKKTFLAKKVVLKKEKLKETAKRRMRDDWMMKTLGHPSSRRKMLITPEGFKLYLRSGIYY